MSKKIPTSVARNIATKYECDQVIVLAFATEGDQKKKHTATYGVNRQNSEAAAAFGARINRLIEGRAKIVTINKWR